MCMKRAVVTGIRIHFAAILLLAGLSGAVPPDLRFEHLTVNDGLSENAVTLVIQDRSGIIWIGTHDGLNRYDGYDFTVYRNVPGDPGSLSDDAVGALCEDAQGMIWVGTIGGGLNRLDPFSGACTRYVHDPRNPRSLGDNDVRQLLPDEKGRIWIVLGATIDRLDPQSNGFIHVFPEKGTLHEAPSGEIWLAVPGGELHAFDEATQRFIRFPLSLPSQRKPGGIIGWHFVAQSDLLLAVLGNELFRFELAKREWPDAGRPFRLPPAAKPVNGALAINGRSLLIATLGDGLFEIDARDRRVRQWQYSANDPSSLGNNLIYHLFQDRSGVVWISTEGGGVSLIRGGKLKFPLYRHRYGDGGTISGNYVTAIHKDAAGFLWIGTGGTGLNRVDEAGSRVRVYRRDARNPHVRLSHDYVTSITPDADPDRLWIGTSSGLNLLDKATGIATVYRHDPANPLSLIRDDVGNTFRDSRGDLWVTASVFLDRRPAGREEFVHYRHDPAVPGSISLGPGYPIYEDREGVIWIGSWAAGLNRYNRGRDDFSHFVHDERDPLSLSHDRVWAIHEDRRGRMWIGTWGGGLNLFDRKRGTFRRFDQRHGLASNVIYGILEDEGGRLWMSTNRGLSRFDPRSGSFRNYDVDDGLQSNEFNTRAFFRDAGGRMYFGGINGYNAFFPGEIAENPRPPPLAITSFRIAGREKRYARSIQDMGEIKLGHGQNFLSFAFSALDFNCPKKNRYRYILEGLEKSWNSVDSRQRVADYRDLDPGRYVFRVTGSNNDGVWNERGLAVAFVIAPPFWGTWWFRLLALLGFGYLSYLFVAFIRGHLRLIHFWRSRSYVGGYKIIERVASGGMGVVYKAVSAADKSRIVALKVLREEQAFGEAQRRRFINEGKIIDSLDHPHIVKVHQRGCQGNDLFIAMEFLEGVTLEERIRRQGILPAAEALDVMRQLGETVAALHGQGVIHRDLKPGNIMLVRVNGRENFVKLLDFGVARTEGMTRLTKSGMLVGTVGYIPPEQVSSAEFGLPGDMYSLGVIFYEMATGHLPFAGETTLEVMKRILAGDPLPPRALNPDLDGRRNTLILSLLSKDPRRRPTAEGFLRSLSDLS